MLLEDEIRQLLEGDNRGIVAVLGPEGSGKTTALRHLASIPDFRSRLVLLDEPDLPAVAQACHADLVVYAATSARPVAHLATLRLAPWGPDDWLEYLIAAHRPQCASVLSRVSEADVLLLGMLPERWTVILDRLAADDSLPDARRAWHRHLGEFLSDTDLLERARSACLNAVLTPKHDLDSVLTILARPGFGPALVRALRCPAARLLLAAERLAADLHGDGACDYLAHSLPRDLVKTAALVASGDEAAREHLLRLLAGPSWSHAMSASLLHALGVGWVPTENVRPVLAGAFLDGANWPGVLLANAELAAVDFEGANLRGAILIKARAPAAMFRRACLSQARLDGLLAPSANFSHADLSQAMAELVNFESADLSNADLTGAVLQSADFLKADLSGAVLSGANLNRADLTSARLAGTNFEDADLTGACLSGLSLREARWDGACFAMARMAGCDLEYLTLPAVDFSVADLTGALLTGSTMHYADFREAKLCNAGLADVDWEGVDLRGADLTGASFHMGSTRSGLVGSPIACEGSRTGFYTDDYEEQCFKPPEEIRKANLCGADLRGARLDGVDFYLVDLRGALYDADQEPHLRRCGAILEARV
jgi:uncharacterized protein YjbI with pentapeptide repeats